MADIIYTQVDEAPQLASASLLPIIQKFLGEAGLSVETRDISLAGRIIASFAADLPADQAQSDALAELGELVKTPAANVIKLPNISASVPQLVAAVKELQSQGFALPDYPEDPQTDAEKAVRAKYDAVKGSAVNPVLREGNSDRRAPAAVKAFAKANPHRMGKWESTSKTRVATMDADDFFSNEQSVTLADAATLRIELDTGTGVTVLKDGLAMPAGTIVDATFMSAKALKAFFDKTIADVAGEGTLYSLHMKATMMKVSDPIIFGHCVRQYLAPVFAKHGAAFDAAGVSPNAGLGDMLAKIAEMDDGAAITAEIETTLAGQPPLYMVNSDKGITNLHVPSDVIIDASMPSVIRAGGKGWGPKGEEADTTCVIPDSSYAGVYAETIDYFKETGALDPATAGTVQNVGLMAQKAEEYGSHPTTFELSEGGTMRVMNGDTVVMSHVVEAGDIWRMASARKAPIENWIELAIERQAAENCRAIFWLDATRAHDAELLKYVLPALEAKGVADKFEVMAPTPATRASFEEIREGKTTIAITGNVLRDYLTDLYPILEVGTSAKMLSVVKLMQGGGLFETGAGGSAPKHVQQLVEENHLRWDSLGEFCALGESLRFAGTAKSRLMGLASDLATEKLLSMGKSPGRKVGQDDNRSSHFHFALYWAEALAAQSEDAALAAAFAPLAAALAEQADVILQELKVGAGQPVDLGGYFHTDPAKTAAVMRPSATFNALIG
ncbi:NADP-dependent isocitrate dehydrogenase [Yoonia sp.]|uniref:NADP-dependent isocitrate dehydrogenase n=1 Tax=Yoonia sp. TaxID=2212373 RepID=UPI0023968362|nr:NADP-dependent isocitrate dehydrogenase [Yoonia sp.]MDE0850041.1 NADP-dependent isocitrate dehydrogenase [Yoonia sp.]